MTEYPGLKKEASKLYPMGYYVKRCLMDFEAHKAFKEPQNIKLLSDVYMYKHLKWCGQVD